MKRTTNRFDNAQMVSEQYVSGCRQFEGEDRSKFWGSYRTRLRWENGTQCCYLKRMGEPAKQRNGLTKSPRTRRRETIRRPDRRPEQNARHAGGWVEPEEGAHDEGDAGGEQEDRKKFQI